MPLDISPAARRDIADILQWSLDRFGNMAEIRYDALIKQAIHDIVTDPERAGSQIRPELPIPGLRSYHLSLSRTHVSGGRVKEPRHFIVYRKRPDDVIDIVRVLHDSRDLARHVPQRDA